MAHSEEEATSGDKDFKSAGNEYADLGKGYAEHASKWVSEVGVDNASESKFDSMNVAADAAGPAAEGNRREMAKWSDAAGHYAEEASRQVNQAGEDVVERGGVAEGVDRKMSEASETVARNGVWDKDGGSDTHTQLGVRKDGSMEVSGFGKLGHGGIDSYRSPTQIRDEQSPPEVQTDEPPAQKAKRRWYSRDKDAA